MSSDHIFTLPQAARALRLPVRALRALVDSGDLPHVLAGDDVLVDIEAVERTLRQHANEAPAAKPRRGSGGGK